MNPQPVSAFSRHRAAFAGGIHPKDHKGLTSEQSIRTLALPELLLLPLAQRFGAPLETLVTVGQQVTMGQLLAASSDPRSVPVHAPASGQILAIDGNPGSQQISLKTSDNRRWGEAPLSGNPFTLDSDTIIQRIRNAGIVGLGGAAFPTALKVASARSKQCDLLLLNGGECEPYLTCDDRLMREYAAEIVAGARLLARAAAISQVVIAVEDNKREALSALQDAVSAAAEVRVAMVPSLYPMGSERHLIHTVSSRLVPPGGLSLDVGVLVQNVATARAVYHAVRFGRPLIDRVITVSGGAISQPANLRVPLGVRISELINACGGLRADAARLVNGGPMMGQVISNPHQPISKSTSGILALTQAEVQSGASAACIRCGRCVAACPMSLLPLTMHASARAGDLDGARAAGLDHCLMCGACAYVCPSHLPLTGVFRAARASHTANQQELKRQERARLQAQMKKERLLREAQAREAAKAAAAAAKPARSSRRGAVTTAATADTTSAASEGES